MDQVDKEVDIVDDQVDKKVGIVEENIQTVAREQENLSLDQVDKEVL